MSAGVREDGLSGRAGSINRTKKRVQSADEAQVGRRAGMIASEWAKLTYHPL